MFQQFVVAYNNAHRILHLLPVRCSASHMFATERVNSCKSVLRKSIYSLSTRISASVNSIIRYISSSDIHCKSILRRHWINCLFTINTSCMQMFVGFLSTMKWYIFLL